MAEVNEFKNITTEDFAKLDFSKVTLLDLREPDELIVSGIEGALNLPFSKIGTGLSDVPKDKPVYVYCRTGDWSEEVSEILADRGYDVTNVLGGYNAYRAYKEAEAKAETEEVKETVDTAAPVAEEPKEEPKVAEEVKTNETVFIDAKGLKCPGPIVKVADALRDLPEGTTVSIEATEDAFYSDIAVWADRTGNTLVSNDYDPNGPLVKTVITKTATQAPVEAAKQTDGPALYEPREHEKTMVVFSGDLDKTIAAFIMANGAAALGRPVTIFFTFWGLNVLRRPEKVNVKKNLIETAFGLMMPRGTKKLGLSRMNMGGAGALMIRWIMKQNGISSLEELIDDAIKHGVRLVACQMSMDIMGIKQEELIDGIELGGVATMLGSAEKSDMTYFI